MSKGAVIIANDIPEIKYTRLARVAAKFVTRNLGLPVTLITDTACDYPEFENVIVVDRGTDNYRTTVMGNVHQTFAWYNLNRTHVYDLTPYDRTLVIDADFFTLTDSLRSHMDANFDFAIAKTIHDPSSSKTLNECLSRIKVNHLWATVMIFNKSPQAQMIFDMAKYVIRHYRTYAKIYDFDIKPIRNDYAFSIACHLLGGYGASNFDLKNYSLTNVNFLNGIHKITDDGRFVIEYNRMAGHQVKKFVQKLPPGDLHFLNKLSLMEHIDQLEQL
jgi:hypothetical protein